MIVFTILIIVNFVVITKGSVRIAVLAAHLGLDGKKLALPDDPAARG